jgi:mannosyltransferase OCH1-like enzyme
LRLILIHRFGGWYSDIDMVFLRPLDPSLRNVISGDHVEHTGMAEKPYLIGTQVNNAIFNFDRGHKFLQICLHLFAKR